MLLPDHIPLRPSLTPRHLLLTRFYIGFIAFTHGVAGISAIPLFLYSKRQLNIKPYRIKSVQILVEFPWVVKPFFGFAIDSLMPAVRRTKALLIPTALLKALVYLCLYRFVLPRALFHLLLLLNCVCFITESLLCDYLVNSAARRKESGTRPLPLYLGCKSLGAVAGALVGFRLMGKVSKRFPLLICSAASALVAAVSLLYPEVPARLPPPSPLRVQACEVRGVLRSRRVLLMLSFLCLARLQPDFGGLYAAFYTSKLKFTASQMAYLFITGICASLAAIGLYTFFLERLRPRRLFRATVAAIIALNLLFVGFLLRPTRRLRVPPFAFCLFYQAAETLVTNLGYLPLHALWSAAFPPNMEGTSIALLACLVGLAGTLGSFLGLGVERLFGLSRDGFAGIWKAGAVQAAYMALLLAVSLFCLRAKEDSSEEHSDIAVPMM